MPQNPWTARGFPLVRRTSPPMPGAAAKSRLPGLADAAGPMTDLVRECLMMPPQPASLHVVRPGISQDMQLRKAWVTHRLEPWEELIAVWQWGRVAGLLSAAPSSLIFMSDGIRIAEPRLRLAIGYDTFAEYTFRYEYILGGRTGPDVAQLVIEGPTAWVSPSAGQDAELIADDLTRIKALVSPP